MNKDTNEIIFVSDNTTPLFESAFDAVSEYENICPRRMNFTSIKERFKSNPPKRICFVFSKFEGECFEYLRSLGAAIYGPQIILHYIRENKALPKLPHPLYSTALINAVATVTSITGAERNRILESVQMLHGQVSRDLTDDVNVVITPKVGSKKYIVGASRGFHIVLPEWINEAWRLSSIQDPIDLMQPMILEKFRVPIFCQLVICVSGLSIEERKEVSDLVIKNGGRYSGMMKVGETTHLIIKHASGLKYLHAKKWKIQIVSLLWLIDSVNKGYALDEEDYRVPELKENSSTPTTDRNKYSLSFDNISVISHAESAQRIDETRSELCHVDSLLSSNKQQQPLQGLLSHCTIMLSDCTREEVQSYTAIIKELGGRLCVELQDLVSESLTHIVVGTSKSTTIKKPVEKGIKYVKGTWLIACQNLMKCAPESEYQIDDEDSTINNQDQTLPAEDCTKREVDVDDLQLINQYFGVDGAAEVDGLFNEMTTVNHAQNHQGFASEMGGSTFTNGIFTGLLFAFHQELSDEIVSELTKLIPPVGGTFVQSVKEANYLISPFFVHQLPDIPDSCRLVTAQWIFHCIHEECLSQNDLSKELAFTPIVRKSNKLPLHGCVISLSGFVGRDRALLTAYAQALGAIVQECFLRKAVPSRNLAASTHLIAAKPDGRKWPAAQQWGLPAVNRNWLYACAKSWKLIEESKFPVNPDLDSLSDKTVEDDCTKILSATSLQSTNTTGHLKELHYNSVRTVNTEANITKTPNLVNEITESNLVTKDLAATMQTPDWVRNTDKRHSDINSSKDSTSFIYKPSPPLSEQVSRCLKNAISTTGALPKRKLDLSDEDLDDLPLRGVVIYVAKHLSARQVELNDIIKQLGGDFKWNYDAAVCTHIIAEHFSPGSTPKSVANKTPFTPGVVMGSQPASYPDVDLAKQDGKFIVQPKWLAACFKTSRRLPETDFLVSESSKPSEYLDGLMEPCAKMARTSSSSLLGDINRRLEIMMSAPGKQVLDGHDENQRETPLIGIKRSDFHTTSVSNGNESPKRDVPDLVASDLDAEAMASASPFLNPARPGQRRLRRNQRRTTLAQTTKPNQSISTNSSDSGGLPKDLNGNGDVCPDLAQPAQSLMVRWKYDDTTSNPVMNDNPCPNENNPQLGTIDPVENGKDHNGFNSNSKPDFTGTNPNLLDNKSVAALEETKTQQLDQKVKESKSYVISFSGLPSDERDHYADIVQKLGGEVDNQITLNEKTTHLIVHTPTRSEKCLICLATGKWMLHKSYLDACLRESRWVDETAYEWGGPGTEPLLMQLSPALPRPMGGGSANAQQQQQQATQIRDLARSARRWRLARGKAFSNWRVIFGPGCDKETSFRRVIEAGGGKVLSSGPPYPPASEVTHAFFKRSQSSGSVPSLPKEYAWLRIDYLCAYLTAGQEVSREEFSL